MLLRRTTSDTCVSQLFCYKVSFQILHQWMLIHVFGGHTYVPVGIIAGICETVQSQPQFVMPCGFVAFALDAFGMAVPAFVALLQRACHNT